MDSNLAMQLETKPRSKDEFEMQLKASGERMVEQAQALQIETDEDAAKAAQLFLRAKDHLKSVDAIINPFVKLAHKSWKDAVAHENDFKLPAEQVVTILRPRLAAHDQKKEAIRKEEERRLQAEANKRAQEEQLAEALHAEALGQQDIAEAIIEAPVYVPTVVVPKVQTTSGVSYRENWKGHVKNLMDLVKAVASGRAPINLLECNTTVLNQQARSLKNNMNYPGVEAICEKIPVDGRR